MSKNTAVDNSRNAIKLTHPFKDILPDVDEFFQANNGVGVVNTINAFCNKVKKYAEFYATRIDPSRFKGDALEILVEYLSLSQGAENRLGINDYKPVILDDDVGVDGHGIGANGNPATVQVKFRRGDWVLTANEDHLSNFIAASWKDFGVKIEDTKNMLIVTTGLKVDEHTLDRMLKNSVRVINREALREMLDNRPEWWIRFYESVKASRNPQGALKIIPLREHQVEAVVSCEGKIIGKIILPTGTGKTMIESELILREIIRLQEQGKIPLIKINASRILLCFQLFEEVFTYLNSHKIQARYANFNSGTPSDQYYINELRHTGGVYREIESTTSPHAMWDFINKAKEERLPTVVFSTYHSAEKFASEFKAEDKKVQIVPDLTIHDEAHNLVSNEFSACAKLPSGKNFFFTATERITDGEKGLGLGMENKEIFGDMLCTKSPRQMIEKGEMVPPHVHVVRARSGVKIDLDKLDKDYEALFKSIGDAFVAHQHKIRENSYNPSQIGAKVLVVCRGQLDLEEMFKTKVFDLFHKNFPDIHLYALSSDFGIYNSDNEQGEEMSEPPVTHVKKFKLLQDIKRLAPSDKCIIFHVDMIGEGIDVPGITGVMPFRNCELAKFVQNIGRAARLHKDDRRRSYAGEILPTDEDRKNGKWIKPYSWVIIPTFLENSDGFCDRFQEIINVLRGDFGYIPRQHTVIDNVVGIDEDEKIKPDNEKIKERPHSDSGLDEFDHEFEQIGFEGFEGFDHTPIGRIILEDELDKGAISVLEALQDLIGSNVVIPEIQSESPETTSESPTKASNEKPTLDPKPSEEKVSKAPKGKFGGLSEVKASPVFTMKVGNADAKAEIRNGMLVVLKGSKASKSTTNSVLPTTVSERKSLVRKGFIKDWVVIKDIPFKSVSGAACVLYGGAVNGKACWKNGEQTIGEFLNN